MPGMGTNRGGTTELGEGPCQWTPAPSVGGLGERWPGAATAQLTGHWLEAPSGLALGLLQLFVCDHLGYKIRGSLSPDPLPEL